MSEVNFSKRQITPLLEKYNISTEDPKFVAIITMFAEQTNYQIWAIKLVFGEGISLDKIKQIQTWASVNPNEIQKLVKKNIVSYNSASKIGELMTEMNGLDLISATKNTVSKFNTAQRDMLRKEIFKNIESGFDAFSNKNFVKWSTLLKRLEIMPQRKRDNVITLASAIDNIAFLEKHIADSLNKTYEWNREDMLGFMEANAKDCKVTFDKDNIVVINVPSFASSKKMCGNGRTAWCLTREERYFNQYVKEPKNAKQYMLFNFNLKEKEELAHIGFTVRDGYGITNAHSGKNQSMTGSGCMINDRAINITTALSEVGVPKGMYIKLKPLKNFAWTHDSVRSFITSHTNDYAISIDTNNRIIVRAMSKTALTRLVDHTLVDMNSINVDKDSKVYLVFNFDLELNHDHSILLLSYRKDTYGTDSLRTIRDVYNGDLTKSTILHDMGIVQDSFLNREDIKPSILLHKYIDEHDEDAAIALIEKASKDLDVNFEFNNRTPIFSALHNGLYRLFEKIISYKSFDCCTCDGFGETLLQSLLYNYNVEGVTSKEDDERVKKMINIILNSTCFDFNVQNLNCDTAINIACEDPKFNWVVDALVANPNVDINVINDIDCTALGNAIRNKNIYAIKALATRSDLVVRSVDEAAAKKFGIDLESYIKTPANPSATATKSSNTSELYAELFAKAFARVHAN